MAENWRECGFAGEPHKIRSEQIIHMNRARDGSTWEETVRSCPLPHVEFVEPEDCVPCPVPEQKRKADLWDACGPALVEAGDGLVSARAPRPGR